MAQNITAPLLRSINLGVQTTYNQQFETAANIWMKYADETTSTGVGELYPRLDLLPGMREWLGARVVNTPSETSFQINNKTFELTIGISRENIEDDRVGVLTPLARQLSYKAANLPDMLCATLLANGTAAPTYDGQNFFDPSHPDYTASVNGVVSATTSPNLFGPGGGETAVSPWYLIAGQQPMKPVIYQRRRPYVITPRFAMTDDNVFFDNQFLWGLDGRSNAGYGMWQTIIRSTAPLNAKNFAIARSAMVSRHQPDGAPMGITPNICMVPSSLKAAAKMLFMGEYADSSINGGVIMSNPWQGECDVIENVWLN